MAKKGLDDRGHGLGRRGAARLPLSRAAIIAMLLGASVGGLLAYGAVAAQEEPNVVSIDNYTFGPKELTIPVGTTVKWVNHDDVRHGVAQKDKAFRAMALDTDDSYSYTFASAGTFDYFCSLHPYMVGKIIVK